MVVRIGSNIASLKAQRSLADATGTLSATFERLSSGMRINRASDDAAGLAVADSLSNQKRLYSASMRNISDGLSALSIATGSLNGQTTIITRMIELAEQSANGTFSSTQRDTMQSEYYQLTKEFARIASTTIFNGRVLLTDSNRGGVGTLNLQAGIDGSRNSNIGVTLGDSGELSGYLDRSNLYYTSGDISGLSDRTEEELRELFGMGGFKIRDNKFVAIFQDGGYGSLSAYVFTLNDNGNYDSSQEVSLGYNSQTGEFNSAATASLLSTSGVDLRALRYTDSTGAYGPNLGTGTNIEFTNIETQTYARQSLEILKSRLQTISQLKGSIGAFESRLKTAMAVNGTQEIESAAAESRIRDIDVASESAILVATQIRQSIAAKVLKNANIQPQIAIKLLQN